jgi:hypothetical protein
MKSGNLNFLEPSGPLQACNGTALPLPYAKSEHNEGIIPVAIKSGRLLDVSIILQVLIFKLVGLCVQCDLMHATLVRTI